MQARIIHASDTLVSMNLHGEGEVGNRPRIGFIACEREVDFPIVLDQLLRGGVHVIDAGNLVGLGVELELLDT